MVEVAKKHQDQLDRIKENIKRSHDYFKNNIDRWNSSRRFLFKSALDERDLNVLKTTSKPAIEFPILNAYVSRLRGEFSKQQPSIKVNVDDETESYQDLQEISQLQQEQKQERIDPAIAEIVEGHIRYIEHQAKNDGVADTVYKDLLSGGFSVFKVWTEYKNPKSFQQVIRFGRVYDPTMCGFDPMARLPHKADGRFSFELYPKSKDEFKQEEPNIDIKKIDFNRDWDGFNWSYRSQKEDILLMALYYEKKKKRIKIAQLANSQFGNDKVIPFDKYDEFSAWYQQQFPFTQTPAIVDTRYTEIDTIVRYKCIESQILEYKETDFKYFPLVFVAGDSAMLRETNNGEMEEFVRPYIYDARGTQKLKNFAGQTLANELENMVQHKWKVPKEGIPEEYVESYVNNQIPNVLIYNQFLENNPDVRLDVPQEVQRSATPPEVASTFMETDKITQSILGSYDASLGINNNQLSGVAIVEGATQSNAAAMPSVIGYMIAYNQVSQIIIDLIPKYITSKSIPIVTDDNKEENRPINQEGSPFLKYHDTALKVKVESGVNFKIQQNRTVQQITALMQASPEFAQIMSTKGLPILIDNLDIRGKDKLKEIVEESTDPKNKPPPPPDPAMLDLQLKQQQLEQKTQESQAKNAVDASKAAIMKEEADTDRMRLMAEIKDGEEQRQVQLERNQTEKVGQAVDMAVKLADSAHKQNKETIELHHKLSPPPLSEQLEE